MPAEQSEPAMVRTTSGSMGMCTAAALAREERMDLPEPRLVDSLESLENLERCQG